MDARLDLAFEHHRAGRLTDAEPLYRQLVAEDSTNALAWHGWGLLAAQQGVVSIGLDRVTRATKLAPGDWTFWNTLGRLHTDQRDFAAAATAYRRAVELNPLAGQTWNQLTAVLRKLGRAAEAVTAGEQAIRLLPESPTAHNHLANALSDAGQDPDAVEHFRTAISVQPNFAEACTNLGSTLTRLGELDEALRWCDQAVHLAPALAEAHNNRGVALTAAGRFDDAIVAYQRAIELRPDYAAAFSNLGVALCNSGADADAAIAACQHAVTLRPADAVLHTNLGMIQLTLARYAPGWAEHEWRLRANPRIAAHTFAQPLWTGESLPRATILLHAEQGFGDTIQFARFIPMVAQRIGHVVVECQPELVALLQSAWPNVPVVARGEPLPPFDVHCPLLSLPLPLEIFDPCDLPAAPYLHADASHDFPHHARHLGLVWAGRTTHSNDRNRSAPLAALAPLSAIPDVIFHSLQRGPAASQALHPPPGLQLQTHDDALENFTTTAALIASLDGVIAVDTAVAHLAGAMGKPVWLLLPYVPDWRWMRHRSDSPWYPTTRVFRQSTWGEWATVAEKVAVALPSVW